MIECSDKNIWYRKRRKSGLKRCFSLLCILCVLIGVVYYYRCVVSELVINLCAEYAYSYSTESVNRAILETVDTSISYNQLINIEKNSAGDIVLLSARPLEINKISRVVSEKTSSFLSTKLRNGIPIPALAFTGVKILAGYGKNISFKTLSVSSVVCDFDSKFSSVGINQTLHSIYLVVKTEVIINLPFNKQNKDCTTEILLCETVLVGKVPEIYLNGAIFQNKG